MTVMRILVGKNFSKSARLWAWPLPPLLSLMTRSICLMPSLQMMESFSQNEVIGHVFFVNAFFAIEVGAGAAVAVFLALIRDVADGPGGGLAAGRFVDDFGADVDGAVSVIDGRGPVFGAIGIEHVAFDVEMRFARLGVVGVFFGVSEGGVEEDELLGETGVRGED